MVFNLTVVNPTAAGHVTVYPTGQARPNSSNINFPRGWVGANLVTVALGTNGAVSLYNSSGSVDLLADVVGWYADNSGAAHGVGQFQEVTPTRLVDTRRRHTRSAAGQTLTDPMTFTLRLDDRRPARQGGRGQHHGRAPADERLPHRLERRRRPAHGLGAQLHGRQDRAQPGHRAGGPVRSVHRHGSHNLPSITSRTARAARSTS